MQFVEGKNVRQLVAGRPLELKTALLIGLQVADALAAAHSRGIIHRDIKSGNVMVTSTGQVKVLDFGLAKLLDDTEAATAGIHRTELTEVGVPYGTATYAAPEQARGDRVDKRADIFSLGVLLYEMLTGTWPFRGKTTIDVRHAVLHDPPRPIAELRSSAIPPRLQQIIDKALAKEPKDRFQNMDDFRNELRQVLHELDEGPAGFQSVTPEPPRHLSGANPVSRAMRWLKSITRTESPTSAPHATPSKSGIHETPFTTIADQEKKSLAILCFRNFSNDPAASFYEFSLADAVITELARMRSLVVRPSSVIARYQGQQRDPREIGQELGVSAVLTAGFIHSGERFRVTAQLIDVATGELLWSDRIDSAASDIIVLQDTIAQRIVEGLSVELSPTEQSEPARPRHAIQRLTSIPARSRPVCAFYFPHLVSRGLRRRYRAFRTRHSTRSKFRARARRARRVLCQSRLQRFWRLGRLRARGSGVHESACDRSEHLRSADVDGVCVSLARSKTESAR